MKTPLLTILILASLAGEAQTKSAATTATNFIGTSTTELWKNAHSVSIADYQQQPQSIWIYSGSKLMTRIDPLPNIAKIDSLVIYVRKSQLTWLNDSTAIIHKQ